ncbi:MAG TPA: hypothetical protein VF516_43750 [Kofleriaceae bacterium]
MKKNTRGRSANREPKKQRVLRLAQETVRVLNPADLARAAGGSGCDTTSWTTDTRTTATLGG